jgi:hypothetical protein
MVKALSNTVSWWHKHEERSSVYRKIMVMRSFLKKRIYFKEHIRWKPTPPCKLWKLQSESHDVDPK